MSARLRGLALALAWLAPALAAAPARAAVPELKLPAPVTRTLENGLQVAVYRMAKLPIVQMQLLVDAGTAAEPADAPGVAHVTAELLLRGTSSRSLQAWVIELDRLAGSIEATATRDYATLDGAFLARDLEQGIELMSDAVVHPLFSESDLRAIQSSTVSAAAGARRHPVTLADEHLWSAVFGDHPYGRPLTGTPESIARLNRDRVLRFYLSQYRPERATLAIAGDVDPERAFAAAREWFGRWTTKPDPPAPAAAEPAPLAKLRIRVVDFPGAPVSHVRLGGVAPARGSDDEAAFTLLNAMLGGTASSRWARGSGAPAPGARSAYTLLRKGGLFATAFAVPHDSVAAAVARARTSLRRIAATPPAESELAPVRGIAAAVFPLRFETLGGVVGYWSALTSAGLPVDPARDAARIAAVRAADVAGAASRWITPDRVAVVVVGPAARLAPALRRLGTVEVVSPGGARASAKPVTGSTESQARGREILKAALAAHGGLLRLERIQDTTVEATATLQMGEREIRGDVVQIRKEPDRMRVQMTFAGVTTVQAVAGDRGWTGSEATADAREMDSVAVAGMRAGFGTDVHHVLLWTQTPGATVASRGREAIGGQDAEAVEVRAGNTRRVLYFDASHRLIAMDQSETASGVPFTARRVYGDYRDVQGMPWPHVEERLLDGRRVMLLEVRRVVVDSGVEDAVFERSGSLPPLPAR